ncbi:MAG: ABC transporter ATP-binding protein [Clostridia bacterium]|nr:ABC transporter ATP-binding protein [Clostridia bacterium]
MIKAENIVKTYNGGTVEVLKGISLEIKDSERVVILGASGSGKSTLLSVLSGLERADGGKVLYGENNLSSMTEKQLTEFRRNNVGFIFQQYYLLPHLNVESNVKMGADLIGNKDFREIIKAVGLEDKLKNKPSELSGGEQQRVCIARALAKNPKILFLDEPTGALDEKTGREILDYILKMQHERGFTMVMVTHNLNIAETADTVIKMNSGIITEVYHNATPKTAFEIGW